MRIEVEDGKIKIILNLSAAERIALDNELTAILSDAKSATYPLLYAIWGKI